MTKPRLSFAMFAFAAALAVGAPAESASGVSGLSEFLDGPEPRFALFAEEIRSQLRVPDGGPVSAPAAAMRDRLVSAGFLPEQAADFFSAAMVLPGPHDERAAIFAYWNPFWDALLFVRANPPRVEALAFTSGERFRGEEPAEGAEAVKTVLPGDSSTLSENLWRIHVATVDEMRRRFPEGAGAPVEFDGALELALAPEEESIVQSRAALRLKLAAMLAGSKTNAVVAAKCLSLLRSAPEMELRRFFDDRALRSFCKSLARLPAPIREGFELHGYVPAREGTLFVFASEAAPRIYATVSFPAGRLDGPFAGAVQMEWYDLATAPELLSALSSRKEAAK